MSAILAPMPRARTPRPKPEDTPEPEAKSDTVRIEADLARKVTMIAIQRKCSVSDLLSPVLRPFIEREFAATVKILAREVRE